MKWLKVLIILLLYNFDFFDFFFRSIAIFVDICYIIPKIKEILPNLHLTNLKISSNIKLRKDEIPQSVAVIKNL